MYTFDGTTQNDDILDTAINVTARYVQVYTDISPTSVSWREVRLFSAAEATDPMPSSLPRWNATTPARPAASLLTSVTDITNLGTLNNGLPGDVIVGFFKPLDALFDGPNYSDQVYFMVVNGLNDPNGTAAQTRQRIRLNFNGVTSLQRLSRTTGQVEVIPWSLVTFWTWSSTAGLATSLNSIPAPPSSGPVVGSD